MDKIKLLQHVKNKCKNEGLVNIAKQLNISPSHLSNITKHIGVINPSEKVLEKLSKISE